MVEVQVQPVVNPFVQEKLNPEHLSMLFPATFYQNDESLALHLTGQYTFSTILRNSFGR